MGKLFLFTAYAKLYTNIYIYIYRSTDYKISNTSPGELGKWVNQ